MKKNYGMLSIFGHSDVEELQTRTAREPSEQELQARVDRTVEAIREKLYAEDDHPFDEGGMRRILLLGHKSALTVTIKPKTDHARVTSEGFGITKITQVSERWSVSTDRPTLFWSGFDDSVMILGVAARGEVHTLHIISDDKDDPLLEPKQGNIDAFRTYIPVKDDEALTQLLHETDIFGHRSWSLPPLALRRERHVKNIGYSEVIV